MQESTAQALSDALESIETTRTDLVAAAAGDKAAKAALYQNAKANAGPAFAAAQAEYDLEVAGQSPAGSTDPTPPAQPAPTQPAPSEAAPGVPLVQPPGVVVDHTNLTAYGPLQKYVSKADPSIVVEATPYAFDAGTAVRTPDGDVATSQPSRVVLSQEPALGIVTQDVFDQTYELAPAEAPESTPADPPSPADPAAGDTPPA